MGRTVGENSIAEPAVRGARAPYPPRMIACPVCATENDDGRKFCIECGTRLSQPCPVCASVNPGGARFCGECGTTLGAGKSGAAGVPSLDPAAVGALPADVSTPVAPVAERRLVSVVFVDLVGFTSASEGRDAEDTRELLTSYYETARDIVGRHGGTIEKFIGDAVMAVWGTPTAHEDDAERAVRSAMELVAAVPRLSPTGQLLQARAGVLTGEAAVSIGAEGQGMVAGDLVNTASRLQSAAVPGSVLVGDATYRAASRAIAFEDAGQRELKGKDGSVHVWEAVSVVALRGGEGRAAVLEPPFVGREDELQVLKDLFHATEREGKPRLVTLFGLAGIGKSRLLWELEKYLDGVVDGVFWQEGRSPSYGEGISYWALAEMLRSRAGINDADDPASARQKVAAMIARFVSDDSERRWIEPRVLGLLGSDQLPSETRDELFAAWRTLFERIASQAPVVLVFLDLQWADQGTLDFVEHMLAWARTSPIVVLAEARPELFDRRPGWGRSVRSATLLHLEPLPNAAMEALLLGLVPNLPSDAVRRIVDRAEGLPLYAVETLRMLVDRGVLEADGRHYVVTGDVPELKVPETLHALIAARLDALTPEQRGLVTDASVLGISFTLPALIGVSRLGEAEVAGLAEGLVRREILIVDSDPRSPDRGQYRFVQGVVREVAYQSLAKRDRQTKHMAAARYFESLGDDEIAGVLATHYLAAHRAAHAGPEADALAAQARVALRAAADRAAALHDLAGAVTYIEDAVSITTDERDQAALHERAVPLAGEAAQFQRAYDHARAARALFGQLGDRLAVVRTAAAEASVQLAEHRDQTTIAMLEADLAAVADLPPSSEVASAQVELARALMLAGRHEAVAWCDRVLAQPTVATARVLLEAIITKGTALQREGRVIEAEALLRGAIAIADAQGNLSASMRSRNNLRVMLMEVNLRDALSGMQDVYDLARRYGQQTWVLHAVGSTLDVAFRLGQWDSYLEQARAEIGETSGYYVHWLHAEEARRQTYRGDPEQAERVFDTVLAAQSIIESEQATSWNLAGKADALIGQGRFEEALATAMTSWGKSAEFDTGLQAGLFSAVATGSAASLATVVGRSHELIAGELPLRVAFDAMGESFDALLGQRWDEGRVAASTAEQLMEKVGAETLLARFRLAYGHLALGRIPDAQRAADLADAFFAERGAMAYVDRYRAAAFVDPSTRKPDTAATPDRASGVRAAG